MSLNTDKAIDRQEPKKGLGRRVQEPETASSVEEGQGETATLEAGIEKLAELMQEIKDQMDRIETAQKNAAEKTEANEKQMERAASQLRRASEFFSDEKRSIRSDVAMRAKNEVGAACADAAETAKAEIVELSTATREQIKAYEAESRERTQRLMKIVLPEKIFKVVKWVAAAVVILVGMTILIKTWM